MRDSVSVAVFIDWQNTYKSAREAFGWRDFPNEYGNYSPLALGRALAAGNGRGPDGRLVRVNIHRGLPSQARDPLSYAANRRQSAAWITEAPDLVIPRLRPLRYGAPGEAPREKGVDVDLALAAAEFVIAGRCDVAVVFSHDTDLVPLVELLAQLAGPGSVETAAWVSPTFRQGLRTPPGVFRHRLGADVFALVERRVNYAQSAEPR